MKYITSFILLIVILGSVYFYLNQTDSGTMGTDQIESNSTLNASFDEQNIGAQTAFKAPNGTPVTIGNLKNDDTISSPFTFTGTVPADWVSEGIVSIELRDPNGVLMAEGYGEAKWLDDNGDPVVGPVAFQATLKFDASDPLLSDGGSIFIKKNVMADESDENYISIAVYVTDEPVDGQDEPGSIPDGLSHVEAGMTDYDSCVAAGGEIIGVSCTTFDGRVFMSNKELIYQCDGGTEISVIHTNDGGIEYSENGQEYVSLASEIVASGEGYANNDIEFRAKGNEAFVMVNGEISISNCQLK